MDDETLELTAYHEAGHAFMAISVGAQVRRVTIEPDRDDGPRRYGDTEVAWRRSQFSEREFRERAVLVALAGPVTEMIYTGDPFHPSVVAEWAADWADAWDLAAALHPSSPRRTAFLEQTIRQLYGFLKRDDRWAALAAVADHLLAYETLDAEQFREIVFQWGIP